MEITALANSHLKNIRYYADEISKLARKQFDTDEKALNEKGCSLDPASLRFNCLGAIDACTSWIKSYCGSIESNIKTAEKLDKEIIDKEVQQ